MRAKYEILAIIFIVIYVCIALSKDFLNYLKNMAYFNDFLKDKKKDLTFRVQ